MLTREENEMLTRVGPGTPCGELMRRYWHPIAATVQLEGNPVRKGRILGEDLVLFRDHSGTLGLIGPRCPHRAMHMAFGIPEQVGLRCPYHGWLFDGTGRCLEQPLAPPDSTFKDRVRTTAYKAQEMGGLIWAYLVNFHSVSKGGWKYIEDDVDRYCPDRELILRLYEEADRLMQQM